jgi:transporter family-2 protein
VNDRLTSLLVPGSAVGAGIVLAIQGDVNGALAGHLGSPATAALLNFSVGTLALLGILIMASFVRPSVVGRRPAGRQRAWWYSGGPIGALAVASIAGSAPVVGAALVAVGLIGGQMVGSLLADEFRLAPGPARPISRDRLLVVVVALLAVALSSLGHTQAAAPVLLAGLVGVGALNAVSSAAQGRLADAWGSGVAAACINFVMGTACLAGLDLLLNVPGESAFLVGPAPPWTYLGGFLGATGLTVMTLIVGRLGVLRLSLGMVTGQLLGALVLDIVFPFSGSEVGITNVLAVMLMGAATLLGRRDGARRLDPEAGEASKKPVAPAELAPAAARSVDCPPL